MDLLQSGDLLQVAGVVEHLDQKVDALIAVMVMVRRSEILSKENRKPNRHFWVSLLGQALIPKI